MKIRNMDKVSATMTDNKQDKFDSVCHLNDKNNRRDVYHSQAVVLYETAFPYSNVQMYIYLHPLLWMPWISFTRKAPAYVSQDNHRRNTRKQVWCTIIIKGSLVPIYGSKRAPALHSAVNKASDKTQTLTQLQN